MTIASKIKSLRQGLGISQNDIADTLGITRPTYAFIESGKKELTLSELRAIAATLGVSPEFLMQDTQLRPKSDLSLNKYKQILLNFLKYAGDSGDGKLTKTKLAKLAYFADFAWFHDHFSPMSGLLYRRIQQGPVPDEYFRVVDELFEEGSISIEQHGTAMMIGATEPSPPSSLLSKEEIALIERVSSKWKDRNTREIVDFTHNQAPWRDTQQGELIPYQLIVLEQKDSLF